MERPLGSTGSVSVRERRQGLIPLLTRQPTQRFGAMQNLWDRRPLAVKDTNANNAKAKVTHSKRLSSDRRHFVEKGSLVLLRQKRSRVELQNKENFAPSDDHMKICARRLCTFTKLGVNGSLTCCREKRSSRCKSAAGAEPSIGCVGISKFVWNRESKTRG